jgi:hypothetical protein
MIIGPLELEYFFNKAGDMPDLELKAFGASPFLPRIVLKHGLIAFREKAYSNGSVIAFKYKKT